MFRITWNSLLLSNGSIFTFTQPMPTVAIAASSSTVMPEKGPAPLRVRISGPMIRR
jgi:hypothetical protein